MKEMFPFNAVYVEGDDGFVIAYIKELPGAHAQGQTIDEARRKLDQSIALVLAENDALNQRTFGRARVLHREKHPYGA
ncbi:MAG TPA: type II toxin-antitoxin system HicB family antitoxin [Thermoanaerobaculia bacterium]|jgi:predicted RNase H-like HicB family nuclease|nr:type II toxin-antitoxin system HicB family antitoxin [Thermoanaerobaculia bacterium]